METISLKINGVVVTAPKGTTTLEAARLAHIEIFTLCFLKEINEIGACRICIVELKNGELVTSCVYPVEEGMEVFINVPKVLDSRKKTFQFLLSNRNRSCLSCVCSEYYEPQELAYELGAEDGAYYDGEKTSSGIDYSVAHMIRDSSKCILCRRRVAVRDNIQGIDMIGVDHRGFATDVGSAFKMDLGETSYVSCGQCIAVCSTGTLTKKDYTGDIFTAIAGPTRHVIVQTTPAAYAGLNEGFRLPISTDVKGKVTAVLCRLSFDKVFNTNPSADLTIIEEVHEFPDRVQNGGVLPLTTSCSSGWVKYCERYFPGIIEDLSSRKSPQQMFGAIARFYYAEKADIDPKNITSVSIMPCTTRKFGIGCDNQDANGVPDVDISTTIKGLAHMIKKPDIRFLNLPDEKFGDPLGLGTGAAVIFGVTGGVMETALRTVVKTLIGEELPRLDFEEVHGIRGIKEATYSVVDMDAKVTAVSGLGNAEELLGKVRSGEVNYRFIEIIGCLSSCVNGGGQPQQLGYVHNTTDIHGLCTKILYSIDSASPVRKSHESLVIKELYSTYLGESGGERTHHLPHTTYVKRTINKRIANEKPNIAAEVGDY